MSFIAVLFLLGTSCRKDVTPPNAVAGTMARAATTEATGLAFQGVTGTILREVWDHVPGNDVSEIPLDLPPSAVLLDSALENGQNRGPNYGDRLRGYVYPPVTGNYTFSLAADDAGELWLSSDDNPANKVKIASTLSWTYFREWAKFTSQKSATVGLQAGRRYYIEVLHKQGGGEDNLSVEWRLPDGTVEAPIPGNRLSPFDTTAEAGAGNYTVSAPITLNGAHDLTISGKSIAGGLVPAITLINCYNIHITKCKLYNSTEVGIHAIYSKNITVDSSYFTNVASGVYVEQTNDGGIVVNGNQFLNMRGPFPHGQFVQFNNVNGPGSSITNNRGENILGQSYPEDAISLYQSSGTSSSPIQITGNWIRGGGPSGSGGGIMLGDAGGNWLTAADNILVNPGEYGMAIAGGDHNVITRNKVYGKSQSFTNVGIYVNSIGGHTVTNATVSDNQVNFWNANNYNNNAWLAPGTDKPAGWDGNAWGAAIDASILPATLLTMK